jgi:uncharacterized protein HemY
VAESVVVIMKKKTKYEMELGGLLGVALLVLVVVVIMRYAARFVNGSVDWEAEF